MQYIRLIIITLLLISTKVYANISVENLPRNMYRCEVVNGDTIILAQLRTVYCFPPRKFTSRRAEEHYWRDVYDIKRTLPLAKLIHGIMMETYEFIELLPTEDAKEKHLKKMQSELFETYKPTLKRLNFRQGKVLIKLIDRECKSSAHELIRAFLGNFAAGFWQGFGRLFGVSLKEPWDPKGKDKDLEQICVMVEYGYL